MNIYVSNLNFSTTSESLQNLFAAYGEVASAKIITDRETGRSRGFGFIEMPDDTEGKKAISGLNETDFDGKAISLAIAHPKTERSNGGYNDRDGNDGRYNKNR